MQEYKTISNQNLVDVVNWMPVAPSWSWSSRMPEWVSWSSAFASALPWRSVLSPVIHTAHLRCKMSNGCLMAVGEASINLIADHWVNFSYLENPSFLKCCECGGIWRRSVSKDKGVVSLKYSLALWDNLYGIYDSCSGDDEVYMLMIVLVLRRDFCFLYLWYFNHRQQRCSLCWGLFMEPDVSQRLSPVSSATMLLIRISFAV